MSKFKHTEHTQKYLKICENLSKNFLNYSWDSLPSLNIDLLKSTAENNQDLSYNFLKISSKISTKIETTPDSELNSFLNDSNVLSVGRILLGPKSNIVLHKDSDYWTEKFYRIHIPKNKTGAIFFYDDGEIEWETGKVDVFDVMGTTHGAKNDSSETFELVYIDITQEDNKNKSSNVYSGKIGLENVNSELVFEIYKKFHSSNSVAEDYINEHVKHFNWKHHPDK